MRDITKPRRLAAVAVATVAPGPALAEERAWGWQWDMHPMVFMWGAGGLVMMLMMLVFWGLVIAGLIVGLRSLLGHGRSIGRDEALEILRQRYARGDIDKQEFEARKRDLGY
jgi:putative membrane protein